MLSLRKLAYGSASHLIRLLLSVLVALTLPPLLVRHLQQAEYSAWVLILQLSTYVAMLDMGLQTVTAKLLAEYHAKGEHDATHRLLSSSVSMLSILAVFALLVVGVLTWKVPELLHQMPVALVSQVRISLALIGFSAAFALPFTAFIAVFTGVQEYGFPTVVALISRGTSTALLIVMVLMGKGLVPMAIVMTVVNIGTSVAPWFGWKRYARDRFSISAFLLDREMVGRLARSGGVFAIWMLGVLFVSGLDVVIVGHYNYQNTGFYSIGATATNFMLMCVTSLFAPLMPAVSAMQANSTARAVGVLTIRASRVCALVLLVLAVPLYVGAYPILSLWVGPAYAAKSALYLQVLILGTVVRTLGYPYATIALATGQQHLATGAVVAEAVVNLAISIWLVQRVGAIGVAYGTLVGAFVSVGLHVLLSMRLTRQSIELSRKEFVLDGILRPLLCTVPVLLLLPFVSWNRTVPAPLALLVSCVVLMGLLVAFVGLTREDRRGLGARLLPPLRKLVSRNA